MHLVRIKIHDRQTDGRPAVLAALVFALVGQLFQLFEHGFVNLAGGKNDRKQREIVVFVRLYQLGADLYAQGSGAAVYEIDWLTDDGRKVHVTVDAQTGAIISRRGG